MPHHLSGGEKRLVSLACVWALQPKAFLLDEPSAFLDPAALERLQRILQHTSQPWIMVSHDLLFLKSLCSDLWITDNGLLRSFY
jgi:cobalt/nickel transport system ATP-binding protein